MFAKLCPWCEERITWPAQLGQRPSSVPPKWYQFSRTTAVCPFCNNPVKLSAKGQAWFLLMFPALLCPASAALFEWPFEISDPWFGAAIVLAIVGGIVSARLLRLEKEHAA